MELWQGASFPLIPRKGSRAGKVCERVPFLELVR